MWLGFLFYCCLLLWYLDLTIVQHCSVVAPNHPPICYFRMFKMGKLTDYILGCSISLASSYFQFCFCIVQSNFIFVDQTNNFMNWHRYVRSLPTNQGFSLPPFNMQKVQLPFMQYDTGFPQFSQIPRTQASLSFRPPSSPVMSPYCAVGPNQTSVEAAYMQWPSAAMMYAHSYEQFRQAAFQVFFGYFLKLWFN